MQGNSGRPPGEQIFSELVYTYREAPDPLLLHEQELERLLKLGENTQGNSGIVVLRGEEGSGRRFLLRHYSHLSGRPVLFADSETFLGAYREYGRGLTYPAACSAAVQGGWLCLCGRKDGDEDACLWRNCLQELTLSGCFCAVTADGDAQMPWDLECAMAEICLKPPGAAEREKLWRYFLKGRKCEAGAEPQELAVRYRMSPGMIRRTADTAELNRISRGGDKITRDDTAAAARLRSPGNMEECAQRIPGVFEWDDFAAEENLVRQLRNLCSYVKYRDMVGEKWGFYRKRPYGNGICALFAGPPGTGKTMAAQIIAGELGLELYRVDLSQVSSKYIGETQKNMSRLFEHAAEKNAILFFDEADALFSKRIQVKDANDRHANSDTAYLLQKLEEYDGVTILASNLKNNVDEAFRRRIRMIINFTLPGKEVRRTLWRKAVPPEAPIEEGTDLNFFADRFEISGSEIKEAVMDAAFLAASAREKISGKHIREALKSCFEKYGRVLSDIDFDKGGAEDGII